jgi:hypothetical protein
MATPREVPDKDRFAKLNRIRAMVGLGAYPITDPHVNPNPRPAPRDESEPQFERSTNHANH